ncbi:MAG: aminotransferase class V-fold PLP-dependent enzyme [Methanobacteriaceae archaeon]|nr:aminotransferase class V-fold PLP-dependent enzyme [Methanobacteriaceae archaeon]
MIELKYKEINQDTKEKMELPPETIDKQLAIETIQKYQSCKKTYILDSGTQAIQTITNVLDTILIPDQGTWKKTLQHAQKRKQNLEILETNDGLIDPEIINQYTNKTDKKVALYITSYAGYTANQPIKDIHKICKENNILLIEDISGSIGDTKNNLAKTKNSEIQVCSTGSPKIINLEQGGFININTDDILLDKSIISKNQPNNSIYKGIINELPKSKKIHNKTYTITQEIKEILKEELINNNEHKIVHPNKNGINIIITAPSNSKAKKLAYHLRKNITTNNQKSIITTCPNYNRIKKAGVAIEIKNIQVETLTSEISSQIADIILDCIYNY